MLEIRLLGRFDVRQDGAPVHITSRNAQSLLAYLALHPGTAERREYLAGLLWPDVPEDTARANLRQVLWRLRQAIGPDYIQADDVSLALAAEGIWVDAAALQTSPGETAVSVYTGDLLPGFYDEWVLPERTRLRVLFEQQAAALVNEWTTQARWTAITGHATQWLSLDPTAEPAVCALMQAYAGLGQTAQVTAVYQRYVQLLADEWGAVPSAAAAALFQRLQTETAVSAHNLPTPLTSFIGREQEMAVLLEWLQAEPLPQRLITLTGAGGSGKTRLTLETARLAAHTGRFTDGVWLVELAALTDPDQVAEAVAGVWNIMDDGSRPLLHSLTTYARHRAMLLLLDNCEHLLIGCAALAASLLAHCPHLVILATSREALRLPGEQVFPVPTLPTPQGIDDLPWLETYAAVQLFAERARTAVPEWQITPANAPAVAHICERLDGLPLALELAAARLNMFTPNELATRLDSMFDLLTGGSRLALPRQQTLRAALDWSYQALSAAEQALLRQMSVFVGGATFTAVAAIYDQPDTLTSLTALVAKSLVLADQLSSPSERPLETRYRLLEPVQQYAAEKLQETEEVTAVCDRHLAHYRSLALQAQANMLTGAQAAWLAQMAADHANLRAALVWARTTDAPEGASLAGAMAVCWYMQAYQQQTGEDETAVNRRVALLHAAALLAETQGNHTLVARLRTAVTS